MAGFPGSAHTVGEEHHQQSLLFFLREFGEEIPKDAQELQLHWFVSVLRVSAQSSCERFQIRFVGWLGDMRIGLLQPSGQEGRRMGELPGQGLCALPGEGVRDSLSSYGGEQFLNRGTVLDREAEVDGGSDPADLIRKIKFLRHA
ncbi:hypothetical protein DBP21_14370 [Streptomyces sp. CS147]|nr:hypothetical protein DBP21_14370 [Streptomyces sp. CS147]